MKKVCYFCGKLMGQKDEHRHETVSHSVCDECADRLKLDERLPALLWAIADMRKQNSSCRELSNEPVTVAVA